MLYVVTLTYIRPMDDIKAHLDTHREWLAEHLKAGTIIAAGPMEPAVGGIVLAHCATREELDAMLKNDSFHRQNLVEYDIRCFKPALGAEAFAEALTLKPNLI
ncbi:YciI family protein (plasmid) [Rhizobium sophoriradicis]|uniref:YciI family protein n=1 Tax=Rhizobium sophoriradicis TaxID=1535245 RepID=UPI00160801B1|nr:YciI family protein [Rhizobium leguminosarum bv. phaseoli]